MFSRGVDFQNPSSKHARFENYETGVRGWRMNLKDGGGEQEVSLSLGLGVAEKTQSRGFTFLQKQELQHQSLINKYIEAGLAVPLQLLVPIWKSVAATMNGCFSHHHPPWGRQMMSMECGRSMDSEPGRCRRTDGKKWRCSKEAVADHKYCERHMHRGRHQRSKKVAEAARTSNVGESSIAIAVASGTVSSNVSVSPSSFVFCAEKAESNFCF